jgi:hypothetical protein
MNWTVQEVTIGGGSAINLRSIVIDSSGPTALRCVQMTISSAGQFIVHGSTLRSALANTVLFLGCGVTVRNGGKLVMTQNTNAETS